MKNIKELSNKFIEEIKYEMEKQQRYRKVKKLYKIANRSKSYEDSIKFGDAAVAFGRFVADHNKK